MSIVVRPYTKSEPDFLKGKEDHDFVVKNLDGVEVARLKAPSGGWTYDSLEALDVYNYSNYYWDAYLNETWVGSSEV